MNSHYLQEQDPKAEDVKLLVFNLIHQNVLGKILAELEQEAYSLISFDVSDPQVAQFEPLVVNIDGIGVESPMDHAMVVEKHQPLHNFGHPLLHNLESWILNPSHIFPQTTSSHQISNQQQIFLFSQRVVLDTQHIWCIKVLDLLKIFLNALKML